MASVFISYARPDVGCAERLAGLLDEAGHTVWYDREIRGGARYAAEIGQALRDTDAVVVLWSNASLESTWVQDEAAEARDSGRLVPVLLDEAQPPLGFRQYHSIPLRGLSDGHVELSLAELLRALENFDGSPPAAVLPETNARAPAVCVIPFANMSGEPEQEYFSDGITEDIITDLSKISALSVISRNTAFGFKARALDVKDVARSAGASHVLEGSVRKAGSRVRITAQLIEGASGSHIWAERYDRELTDIFAIQDEISQAIVAALQLKLLPGERQAIENRGTGSVEAYNLYLMARQEWVGGSYGSLRRDETIARICRQATIIDPSYGQAWALLALAQAELRFWHGRDEDAISAAERALSLNPKLAEPYCVIGRYRDIEGRSAEAKENIDEALRLDPESWEVNREAGRLTVRQGRLLDAIPFFEKAVSVANTDWHNAAMLFMCYRKTGDRDNLDRVMRLALERAREAVARDPTNGSAIATIVAALAHFGEQERAREWIQRGLLLDPDNISMLYNLGCALIVGLRDADAALDILEAFFERTTSIEHIKHVVGDPDLDPVRASPRFQSMLAASKERLGLPREPQSGDRSEAAASPGKRA